MLLLENAVITMTCVIKDGDKFYPQLSIKVPLHDKETQHEPPKKSRSKELMSVALYPIKWWDWCLLKD